VTAFPRRGWLRGAIGTATAFVLALQMLLAGMLATQMAVAGPADPFVICYGSGHGGDDAQPGSSGTRVHHASCVICAFASAAPPVADVVQSLAVMVATQVVVSPCVPALPSASRHHDPRSSQGPPQAA
jgi:hypothetical protein